MRRTTGLLILLILAGLLWSSRDRTGAASPDPDAPAGAAAPPGAAAEPASLDRGPPPGAVAVVALDPGECSDAGYLCTGIVEIPDARAIRWPDGTGTLRIRVPVPEGLAPTAARELQRQAAAGIREWQGRPLPLQVETSAMGGPVDVAVRWVDDLDDDRIGQATVRWRVGGGSPELAVDDFVLSTRDPAGGPVPPERIRLTAAHEMGHVLGLPHSDDPDDVMYPYNTATRLTFRDFRTLEVLYRLPAGARIVPTSRR